MNAMMPWVILGMTAATVATRGLPFLLFSKRAGHPILEFLGRRLPPTMMVLLLLYCLKDVRWLAKSHGLPELAGLAAVVGLQAWRGNMVLSTFLGTGLYMALIRL